jgi:hypothetical protein
MASCRWERVGSARGSGGRRKSFMSEENKAVVRWEMEELFNQGGNLDAEEEIYAPNYVGHEPTSGDI